MSKKSTWGFIVLLALAASVSAQDQNASSQPQEEDQSKPDIDFISKDGKQGANYAEAYQKSEQALSDKDQAGADYRSAMEGGDPASIAKAEKKLSAAKDKLIAAQN